MNKRRWPPRVLVRCDFCDTRPRTRRCAARPASFGYVPLTTDRGIPGWRGERGPVVERRPVLVIDAVAVEIPLGGVAPRTSTARRSARAHTVAAAATAPARGAMMPPGTRDPRIGRGNGRRRRPVAEHPIPIPILASAVIDDDVPPKRGLIIRPLLIPPASPRRGPIVDRHECETDALVSPSSAWEATTTTTATTTIDPSSARRRATRRGNP